MKKKLLAVLLCAVMVTAMSGCGKKETSKKESGKKTSEATEVVKEDTKSVHKSEDTKAADANNKENNKDKKDDDEIVPGTSKTNAYLLPLNTKVFGTVKNDQFAWFSFTTGNQSRDTYKVTFVNENTDSENIQGVLMDEYGEQICGPYGGLQAQNDGTPATISTDELEPNTTYYIKLNSNGGYDCDYSLIIKNISDTSTAYKTIGNVSDAIRTTAQDGDTVTGGSNVNEAVEIPLEASVHGIAEGDVISWFSFTTGEQTKATYNITFVNDSPKSDYVQVSLIDEYGEQICGPYGGLQAQNDGTPATISTDELEPNTTYYLKLSSGNGYDSNYSLAIKSPDAESQQSDLIFETPFEINDTQIQFVAESDKLIDEAQAKKVLKPVAEAILNHPDASVLLAGTTATDGKQADRVKLSDRRAEAVKKILVNTFHVPETQLQTIGLGFEADPFERGQDRDASGKFVESEGRKNRRVVVMDAKDPIAQQILGK